MTILWGATAYKTQMHHQVLDTVGGVPVDIVQKSAGFDIEVRWDVPAALLPLIGPSDKFRLRAFAESIGPGQETIIGTTCMSPPTTIREVFVDGVGGQPSYIGNIVVPGGQLEGEGDEYGGLPVSGLYRIVCVLQHVNGLGYPYTITNISGFSDDELMIAIKTP